MLPRVGEALAIGLKPLDSVGGQTPGKTPQERQQAHLNSLKSKQLGENAPALIEPEGIKPPASQQKAVSLKVVPRDESDQSDSEESSPQQSSDPSHDPSSDPSPDKKGEATRFERDQTAQAEVIPPSSSVTGTAANRAYKKAKTLAPESASQKSFGETVFQLFQLLHVSSGSLVRWIGNRSYILAAKKQKKTGKFRKGALVDRKAE